MSLSQWAIAEARAKPIVKPASVPTSSQVLARRRDNRSNVEKKKPQATWPLTNEQLLLHWSVMTVARVNCWGPPKFSTW